MVEGIRHNIPLAALTEATAIQEVLELQKRPLARVAGSWEDDVETYLRAGRGAGKLSDSTAETRGIVLLAIGKELNLQHTRSFTPALAARWHQLQIAKAAQAVKDGKAPPNPNTPRDYLAHLRAFCKWCVATNRMTADPTAEIDLGPREDNTREIFLEAQEIAVLLAAARNAGDRDMEFIIALGCECGMRRGEIAACRPEWFDMTRRSVTIPASEAKDIAAPAAGKWKRKGQDGRRRAVTIPLSDVMIEIIAHHGLPKPFVVAPQKKEWGKSRYRFEFAKRYRKFMDEHAPRRVTIHDCRRSFGSNRVSAGVSLDKVANWLGIRRATAEKRYTRFIPADPEINRGSSVAAVVVAPVAPPTTAAAPLDVAARLGKVESLHQAGLITDEERAAKRSALLAEI